MTALHLPGSSLPALLAAHALAVPEQAALVQRFRAFHDSSPDAFQRHHPPGHFTASCWLVSGDAERVLLTHHRKLDRWLQLGGHADGDTDLVAVALKEAIEESGLSALQIEPAIFDLDVHPIPARGHDPEHLHWDVRFVIRATGDEHFVVSEESLALRWWPVAALAKASGMDESVIRMARRWRLRCAAMTNVA